MAEKANWSLDSYDLVKDIEKRYLAGFYVRALIAFDPTQDGGTNQTTQYADEESKQAIPAVMLSPSTGRALDRASF